MLSSEDMTWETPKDFFDELNKEFNSVEQLRVQQNLNIYLVLNQQ